MITVPTSPAIAATDASVNDLIAGARLAQARWAALPIRERLKPLKQLRHRIASSAESLADAVASAHRTRAETLVSEVVPLADAIRFLERRAAVILRPRRFGPRGRPLWLGRTRLEVRREPFGVVLIVSPSNYPLLLAGVQALQALAAGNAVLVKPAPGHSAPVRCLRSLLDVEPGLFEVLPEDVAAVLDAVRAGVDKIVFTGSAENGADVLERLAPHLIPATMELSGHDAVFVCDDADLDVVARCVAYGLSLNGGNTCIAPRRVFVPRAMAADLERRLANLVDFGSHGSAHAAPAAVSIVPVADVEQALALDRECPYALGASVFGSREAAARVATRVNAGCVVLNDVIVPTADPRLPFGGRGRSGFGVTRGAEGLLEMTRVKAIAARVGSFRPHLDPPHPRGAELFADYLAAAHGASLAGRVRAAARVVRALVQRGGKAP
jgi:acyl-CoA reductase-like NAD-dependent aldehyde dehydrogenase